MKFTCDTDKLSRALSDVGTVIRKSAIQILNNVLIEARGEHVHITGTDQDRIYTKRIHAQVEEDGKTTVAAARIAPLVAALPKGSQTTFTLKEGGAHLACGKSKFRFGALAADAFPVIPFGEALASFDVDSAFLHALDRARHAAYESGAVTEVAIQGALMRRVGDKIHLASTDRTRLARWEIDAIDGSENMDLMIPSNAIDLILKIAPDGALIECAENVIRVQGADDTLIAKVLEQGAFPSGYVGLIEGATAAATQTAFVDTDDLDAAIARLQTINDDKDRMIRFTFDGGNLTITPVRRSDADGSEEVGFEGNAGEVQIAIKSNLVRDALKAIDADTVQIAVSGPQAPFILTAPTKPEAIVIIMTAAA